MCHSEKGLRYLAIAAVIAMPAAAVAADDPKWVPRVEVAASGGFVGLTEVTMQTVPNLVCPSPTPTTQNPACTLDAEHVLAIKNVNHSWKPATSTGIIFRWIFYRSDGNDDTNDGVGAGIGVHFVFVPVGSETKAAPALTAHFGKKNLQFFIGSVFVATDKVELPGAADREIVPAAFQVSSLIRKDGGREPTFFAGIVIGAVSVTKAPSSLTKLIR
jgi:hypothetical protein